MHAFVQSTVHTIWKRKGCGVHSSILRLQSQTVKKNLFLGGMSPHLLFMHFILIYMYTYYEIPPHPTVLDETLTNLCCQIDSHFWEACKIYILRLDFVQHCQGWCFCYWPISLVKASQMWPLNVLSFTLHMKKKEILQCILCKILKHIPKGCLFVFAQAFRTVFMRWGVSEKK